MTALYFGINALMVYKSTEKKGFNPLLAIWLMALGLPMLIIYYIFK